MSVKLETRPAAGFGDRAELNIFVSDAFTHGNGCLLR